LPPLKQRFAASEAKVCRILAAKREERSEVLNQTFAARHKTEAKLCRERGAQERVMDNSTGTQPVGGIAGYFARKADMHQKLADDESLKARMREWHRRRAEHWLAILGEFNAAQEADAVGRPAKDLIDRLFGDFGE
jgi:hypothetical protein